MDVPTGFTLKSEEFQLTDFSKNRFVQKLEHLSLIFSFLAFTVHSYLRCKTNKMGGGAQMTLLTIWKTSWGKTYPTTIMPAAGCGS